MTLRDALMESELPEVAVDVIEDVLYASPQPPSMARFKRRLEAISALNDEYARYRYRVYARLLRRWRQRQRAPK